MEQEVEVHQTGVRLPRGDRTGHPGVVQRSGTSKPARQSFLGADVVPGKHLQASEAPEQRVLGGPATDAPQLEQLLADRVAISSTNGIPAVVDALIAAMKA